MVLLPFCLYSQVELVSVDATKTYPDNTRISYLQLAALPVDADFLQFVEEEVLLNTLIYRFELVEGGETCFIESHRDITKNMIVEAINDAYDLYYTTVDYTEVANISAFKDGTFEKGDDLQTKRLKDLKDTQKDNDVIIADDSTAISNSSRDTTVFEDVSFSYEFDWAETINSTPEVEMVKSITSDCNSSTAFCTSDNYIFPASTDVSNL